MSEAEIRRNLWDRAANTYRRLIDTASVAWDTSTPGQASAAVPDGGITLAKLASDAYQQGSWTPVFTFATPGDLNIAFDVQDGRYHRIGNMAHVAFRIRTSTFTHTTAAGNLQISQSGGGGIPFANGGIFAMGPLRWTGITKAGYTDIAVRSAPGEAIYQLNASGSGVGAALVAAADVPSGGTVELIGSVIYRAT